MNDDSIILYRNWRIVPFALPQSDGLWCVNCEIGKIDAHGLNSFQGVLQTIIRDQKNVAIEDACEQAKHYIDSIIADPAY